MSDASDASRHFSGADVLDGVETFLARYVVFPDEHARVAAVLWAAHAHVFSVFDSTPRLAFVAPEKGCGKSRAQEVIETLVPNPLRTSSVTSAALFRSIGNGVTVFIDEVDTIWTGRGTAEELRAVVNAGHRPGSGAARIEKDEKGGMKPRTFDTFAPLCLAGIGDLPATVADRAVVVTMKRRLSSEPVQPWRFRTSTPEGHQHRDALAGWLETVLDDLHECYPAPEEAVTDRAWDVWEPLITIAEAAGGQWPGRARVACLTLTEAHHSNRPETLGLRLLADLRTIWPPGETFVTSTGLCDYLSAIDEARWGSITPKRLATLLRPYRVHPQQRDGRDVRGYQRAHLSDPWSRYLPTEASRSVASVGAAPRGSVSPCATCGASKDRAAHLVGADTCTGCESETLIRERLGGVGVARDGA